MKLAMLAAILLSCLAGCSGAKMNGPLTQASLDGIQSGCGMSAARLVSANPGEKAKIAITGLSMDTGNEEGFNLISQSKCLQDKLAEAGVDAEFTADLVNPAMQQKIDNAAASLTVK